ncbi:insulinase family protein [Anabaena sp. FACHB-1237]|uniref:M16 family metallopeptidase n=1 Tax=Anabaena sp. FACHB-1237 TaxID=2692769 RepID=UPI001681A251|nr:pitrilysin family protein [Anabaena sp. FACHB-1237]MBD2136097.1 insulinase family protein [Anabaena sp. FACHB-1237]
MKTALIDNLIHRTVLDNGIVLLVSENQGSDIIAGRIFIRTGSCYEPKEKAGLLNLLASLMTKGCADLSSVEIAETIESVGASLSTDAGTDYFVLSLKTVSADFLDIFTLGEKILRSPTFPPQQIELEKKLALQDIRSQKEQPFSIAFEKLREVMYADHPYGISVLGTENSINNITRDDLIAYHQTHFRSDQIVISIAGKITPLQAEELVNNTFKNWQIPPEPKPSLNLPAINININNINPKKCLYPMTTQQSIIILGYMGTSVKDPNFAALKVLATYLGNGLSSRLFVELRERQGLAYDVSAMYSTRLFPASFIVYIGTAPENTLVAYQGLYEEVALLSQQELSAEALQTAKNKIIGQYALGKQTNASIAYIYGWYEILGLGIEFDQKFPQIINHVTSQDLMVVANKYLQDPYLSLVGPETAIQIIMQHLS